MNKTNAAADLVLRYLIARAYSGEKRSDRRRTSNTGSQVASGLSPEFY
jgi:hypothetical protein